MAWVTVRQATELTGKAGVPCIGIWRKAAYHTVRKLMVVGWWIPASLSGCTVS